ncbi:MAG: hypothetical protein U5M53_04605 [Rhodoferax sp.]|nr:hypothetical protein [Rhodoferax sp.]
MSNKKLSTVTNELIASYGNTAKNVIQAYRVGNARAVGYVDQTWAAAVKKAGKRISAEVGSNAVAAQKKVTTFYSHGVTLTSDGAETAVNKALELAGKGLEQVAANASRFEKSTGLSTLNTIAVAAVPAAVAVGSVVAKIEAQSGALVTRIAGAKKAKTTAKRATVRKTRTTAARKAA